MDGLTPICPYCHEFSRRVTGEVIYPHRADLADKVFYQCAPCDAYVGAHAATGKPLGCLANAELRRWKVRAHDALDPHWRTGAMKRGQAYARLAKQMGVPAEACHIGEFNAEQCQRVVSLCARWT